MLGVGNNGTADAGRNLALALALAVFGSTDVDVAAGFKQQVVLGDQTAAADGDIAFFGKQTGFTAHGQGAAADAADLARSLPLIVKGAEGGDMVSVVDGETAALAAAGLPAAVGRGQQSDVVAGIQQGIAFGGDLCAFGFDVAFGGTDAEMAAGCQRAADGFGAAAILHLRVAAAAAADHDRGAGGLAGFGRGAAALHPVTDDTVAVPAALHGFVPGVFAGGIGVVSDADREAALFALCPAVLFAAVIGFAKGNFAPLQLQIATGIQLCGFSNQFAAPHYGGVAFQAAYLRGDYGRRYAVLLQVFLGLAVTGHRYAVFQAAG